MQSSEMVPYRAGRWRITLGQLLRETSVAAAAVAGVQRPVRLAQYVTTAAQHNTLRPSLTGMSPAARFD